MDFGDILNQWDDLCRQEAAEKKARACGTNKPRPRLPNAPSLMKEIDSDKGAASPDLTFTADTKKIASEKKRA